MKLFRHLLPLLILPFLFFSCKKEKVYRIGVSQCSEDDWRMLLNDEIEQEMMFFPEASVEIRSAQDDSNRQIEDIRYFIDNNFDIIIAAPNEADALTPIISEAFDKGIPVIIFDRGINGESYTAFQGAENEEIGAQAARYAENLFPDGAKVLELRGLGSSTPAVGRGNGFHNYIDSTGSNLSVVASAAADWSYEKAVKVSDSLLTIYPDVEVIYAHNDRMALGASDVAARKKLHPKIIGVDAAPEIGMKAVAEGKIDATFLYPTEGQQLIRTAMAILKGDSFERNYLIPVTPPIDRSNIDLLLLQSEHMTDETAKLQLLKKEMDDYWSQHTSQTGILYAAIAILILVCVVLFLVLRAFWQHKRHRAELMEKNRLLEEQRDLEKELNSQLAAATQSKLTFFTNVSHDLRTPLTLIADPVEQVAHAPNLTEQQRNLMRIADKNVKILRRLINHILDFRKYENDRLDLHLEEANPAIFGHEWTEAFRPLAAKNHILYNVSIEIPDTFSMAFDVEKLESVTFNILSNAFKFTPVKGTISFTMKLEDDSLKIIIADTGSGISAENLKHIFARFYQIDKIRPQGSGIGLSLAKAFVELHEGSITVESEVDKGTEFIVSIPVRHVGNKASADTLAQSAESARAVASLVEDIEVTVPEIPQEGSNRPLLLVIDDNEDIRLMINELMKDNYQIIGARNGKEGISLAAKYVPDVIICDVMMPGIDGMETCKAIKKEISTSHIPVLMLTACSLDEQRVEGYESGADGYMSKPFNSEVLKARVASLIANRKLVRDTLLGEAPGVTASDKENDFYRRFVAIVNEEMGNEALSVDMMAEKLGLGRSQFYRKLKAITGLSPVELLKDLRLKRARHLLLSTDKTVSEIGYEVGFSNPAYFTKCYREVYSETPTATRESIHK